MHPFRSSHHCSLRRLCVVLRLNLYGFRRLTQGQDAGAYYHELFLRGRPQLSLRMQRQKVKGTGHKQPADAMTEPNFYVMPASVSSPEHGFHESTDSPIFSMDSTLQRTADQSRRACYDEMSPGMRNLHGAANLLKNIADGIPVSSMKGTPLTLGDSALSVPILVKEGIVQPQGGETGQPPQANFSTGSTSASTPSNQASKLKARISFLSLGDRPMSLLGRVNMEQQPSNSIGQPQRTPSVWPSVQRQTDFQVSNDRPRKDSGPTRHPGAHSTTPCSQISSCSSLTSHFKEDDSGPMELKVSNNLNTSETEEV
jgi:hypothetical protein